MFPRNENWNEGTFGCSPGTKTGTTVRSDVPPERKPERGYIHQNHPFTKPPFLGNGRNTVSRVLFRTRELTEFWGELAEFCEKLGEFALAHK